MVRNPEVEIDDVGGWVRELLVVVDAGTGHMVLAALAQAQYS